MDLIYKLYCSGGDESRCSNPNDDTFESESISSEESEDT